MRTAEVDVPTVPALGLDGVERIRTVTSIVTERLREEIRSGALEPGSRLRQVQIADRFHVSTTPVREAFAALEREGLLVSSSHRGVVVFRPSVDDLQEIYEIRIPLEALATEKAVPNVTDQDLLALSELLDQMRSSAGHPADYATLNRDFHARIYAAARRPKLEKMVQDLRDASNAYMRLYATLVVTPDVTQREHEEIFDAIRARAAKRAAQAVVDHLQHTVDFVTRGLENQPR